MARNKTAREKLETQREAKVVDDPRGQGKMLIPRPMDVDSLIRRIKRGKLVTVAQLRERLAGDAGADFTCPLTTGIFIRRAAAAAEEDRRAGKQAITPYWRVIRNDGSLNDKAPGGIEAQAKQLRVEGHTIEPPKERKGLRIKDFEKRLQPL